MGGRLDTINVTDNPVLTTITSIALDHTEHFGPTVETTAVKRSKYEA
nr:hypothetical protein [Wolbachia endosymbiont of Brugia malayi]